MAMPRGGGRGGWDGGGVLASGAWAASPGPLQVNLGSGDATGYLRLVVLFASVSLAPALLAVLTSFLRIVVVLYFLRAGWARSNCYPIRC